MLPPTELIPRASSDYLAITHPQVKRAIDHIKLHAFRRELPLSVLAEISGASLSNLYNLFRKELHATPAEIILRFRLEEAHHLVLSTEQKIGAIAEACGFASLRTLQRCYYNKYGMYPTQTRSSQPPAGLI